MTGEIVRWGTRKNSPGWIVDEKGCHIWQGSRAGKGYGHVWDPEQKRLRVVHRIRYEREVGPIPEGMHLDHYRCDNGPGGCCNPHHCRPVTPRENALRGNTITAAAMAKTHCPRGHAYNEENTYRYPDGRRDCLTCLRARNARSTRLWRHRRRAS